MLICLYLRNDMKLGITLEISRKRETEGKSLRYILTFDIGTTAVKTCIFNEELTCVASANEEYALLTGPGNVVELEPEVYWQAVKSGIAKTAPKADLREAIAAVCITTQGETLIPVDRTGTPLRNAIVWLDSRAEEEAAFVGTLDVAKDIYQRTGVLTVDAIAPLSKLLWIKKHEPEVYADTYKFLLLEDYIIFRLTGEFATEKVLMSTTAYFDIRKGELFREVFEHTGLDADKIPAVYNPGDVIAGVSKEAAEQTGLSAGAKVVAGAMDQVTAAVGGGNLTSGIVTETTGTCMAIMTTADESCFNEAGNVNIYPHVLPGKFYYIPFCMTAGVVQKWFKDEFCGAEQALAKEKGVSVYEILGDMVEACAPGANGLLMIPYLNGILQPENDPDMRGIFYGISLDTKKPQFLRAIYEGVGYMLRENIELIESLGIEVTEIRSFGGGSKSDVWQQIKSDISGKRISTMTETECASLGAAILASVALGIFPDVETAAKANRINHSNEPNPKTKAVYEKSYQKYMKLLALAKELNEND